MSLTRIAVDAAAPRARVALVAGAVIPRLISRGPRSARVALVAGGAQLLGGDRIEIAIAVGDDCTLELEDVGGTVAYSADGVASFWDVEIAVGARARLTWAGLPLIVSDGANVYRSTRITLGADGTALVRESTVWGRSGERGGVAHLRSTVTDQDGAVFDEVLDADGAHPVPGVLGENSVLDSMLCVGYRPEMSGSPMAASATVMVLVAPGYVARYLGTHAHQSPLTALWDDWCAAPAAEGDLAHASA